MSNFVFVLDSHKRPLNPIRPGMARKLLTTNKAAVFRRYPFTKELGLKPRPSRTALILFDFSRLYQ
ncbi:RRXRR domain-containing protein, partial [Microcoleus sp. AR_TQ3_B6]|uniref:RRXRR domain-containing protein n=1 Tax=Microcoleus sp. AR_TQ3_B6 TaxID=3055284 RepID=UPI002FCEF22F